MLHKPAKILRNTNGSLSEVPLPLLLHALSCAKQTCGLELKRQAFEKVLLIQEGAPVGCHTNVAGETLGKYLVEKRVIDEQQHLKLLADSARARLKLEDVLLKRGVLDAAALAKHVQANLAVRILDCFRWSDARYRIIGDPEMVEGPRMNAVQLIYTGVCNFLSAEQLAALLPLGPEQRLARVHAPAHPIDELKLSEKDLRVLELLETRPTVAEAKAQSGLSPEEATRRLAALAVLGLIDRAKNVPEVPARPAVRAAPIDVPEEELARTIRPRRPALWVAAAVAAAAVAGAVLAFRSPSPAPAEKTAVAIVPPRARPAPVYVVPPPGARPQPHKPRRLELSASGIRLHPPELERSAPQASAVHEASWLLREGKPDQALTEFRKLSEGAPQLAAGWYGAALSLYELRQDEEARPLLDRALAADPNHLGSLLLAAFLDQQAGRLEQARKGYQAYLKAAPDSEHAEDLRSLLEQLPATAAPAPIAPGGSR